MDTFGVFVCNTGVYRIWILLFFWCKIQNWSFCSHFSPFHMKNKTFFGIYVERVTMSQASRSVCLTLAVTAVPCCGRLENAKNYVPLNKPWQYPLHWLMPVLTVSIWPHRRIPSRHNGNIRPTMGTNAITSWGYNVKFVRYSTANFECSLMIEVKVTCWFFRRMLFANRKSWWESCLSTEPQSWYACRDGCGIV